MGNSIFGGGAKLREPPVISRQPAKTTRAILSTLMWPTRPATVPPPGDIPLVGRWSSAYSYGFLGVLTVACLLPFSGRAFHMDDPLFVFAARQIVQHPLDPYGFNVIWYESLNRMGGRYHNSPRAFFYALR